MVEVALLPVDPNVFGSEGLPSINKVAVTPITVARTGKPSEKKKDKKACSLFV
jgi:hypothetical protein